MRQTFKLGDAINKRKLDSTGWPVALFADDDFGHAGFFAGFLGVVLVAVDEHDDVGVLLNRTGLAQVAHHGAFVGAAFYAPA